jgi:hypothetical protein
MQTSVWSANVDSARVWAGPPRRDIFIWASAIILSNQLFGAIVEAQTSSINDLLSDLSTVGVFQIMAWYAIFRLFAAADPTPKAQLQDILIPAALCLLALLPTNPMIWSAALGVAIFGIISSKGDPKLRAGAIVLAALTVQQFWGHIFFNFFAIFLLQAETAVVGTVLQMIRAGTVWRENIITGPSGHGLIIYSTCSSFHNLSLAGLCWVTISKLRNPQWRNRDLIVGLSVIMVMFVLNVMRLCLMAWNVGLYHYWHEGVGARIFATGATVAILLISYCGSRSEKFVR